MKTILAPLCVYLAATSLALSEESSWPDEMICGAGLYNYFFLNKAPALIGDTEGWLVFRSASGATYDCQIDGDIVEFRWKTDFNPMSSRSTRFEANDDVLTIIGDMSTVSFRRIGNEWAPVE